PQNDVTLKMPAFEWVHVQLHQQKGMISLSPPTICNSAFSGGLAMYGYLRWLRNEKAMRLKEDLPYTNSLFIISLILMVVAVIVMGLVLYAG
ncbi:hypothetical protein QS255_08710, partial [Escherichia coli]|nr:hypothetical protein [Escherichia coli]